MRACFRIHRGKILLQLRRKSVALPWFPQPVSPAIPAPGRSLRAQRIGGSD